MKKNSKKNPTIKLGKLFFSVFFLFLSVFFFLSYFNLAGIIGKFSKKISIFLFGKGTYFLFLVFFLISLSLSFSKVENFKKILILSSVFCILSIVGLLKEGILGKFLSVVLEKLLGEIITKILFFGIFSASLYGFFYLVKEERGEEGKVSFLKKIFQPKFKVVPLQLEKEVTKKIVEKEEIPKQKKISEYKTFPPELLEDEKGSAQPADIEKNAQLIKKTLEDFGIKVQMGPVSVGPTVTQYTLKPAEGTKLSKISALNREISLALASHPIRIEAPIPGKSLVGIEVPNKVREVVRLKKLIFSQNFQKAKGNLVFVLGKDVAGEPQFADLSKMPHLLVAGATGTGKTIFLNTILISFLAKLSPQNLRLLLIDPKRVEFNLYEDLPHLIPPIIHEVNEVIKVCDWLIEEMEGRFEDFSQEKVRNIEEYNQKAEKEKIQKIPYIVLIIDELADIMIQRGKEIEAKIVKLAQKARAVGIHLILATQRPSAEILTGLIKTNITSRIAFQVPSQVDSRTILDTAGAEKLLGLGDMLFLSPEIGKPKRIQAPFVSQAEIKRIVEWLKNNVERPKEDFLAQTLQEALKRTEKREVYLDIDDPLIEEAKKLIFQTKRASASFLQRRLKIGYARAARILDILEQMGIVGKADGAKPREVYLPDDWKEC